MTAQDVLREALLVVRSGGDPFPCRGGTFCLRCCCAIAKGRLDDRQGTGLDGLAALYHFFDVVASDASLIGAVEMVAHADGATPTQESAERVLLECLGGTTAEVRP